MYIYSKTPYELILIDSNFFSRKYIGDTYVRHGGYNEVADLNDIIILYPQAIKSLLHGNPNGCWDWWGYTGLTFGMILFFFHFCSFSKDHGHVNSLEISFIVISIIVANLLYFKSEV